MLHDFILHCLVFREQSPSLISATHLLYRIDLFLSRTFLNSFLKHFGENSHNHLPVKAWCRFCFRRISQRLVLWYTLFYLLSTLFYKKLKTQKSKSISHTFNRQITVCRLHESHSKQLFAAARGSANTTREMFF